MKKSVLIFAAGVVLGGFAGALLFSYASTASHDARVSVHAVSELLSHQSYEVPGTYSDTRLIVFLEGEDGLSAEVLCQFSHGSFDAAQIPAKVRIGPVSKKFGFGRQGYFCEAVTAGS